MAVRTRSHRCGIQCAPPDGRQRPRHFKNIEGYIEIDPDKPGEVVVEATINAEALWSGDSYRDQQLRSADFLDVENCPEIDTLDRGGVVVGDIVNVTIDLEALLTDN